ncbi:MAG: DUF3352 domain-containing protein [Cyanobacteriota bacterium]|nr:DUF3352 domain-containing protein [Cyanobacteriota bacterium]
MKARPFLAVVLALGLTFLSLGIGGWWLLAQRGPLALQHQPLAVPPLARFVPRQAPLALYWLSDGERPVAYARAVASPGRRRAAAAAVEAVRDGAFAAAGLDYHDELAPWLGRELALAFTDPPAPEAPAGWLLALRSRDAAGARRFLQRFWQTRSLAGVDLQVSSFRGMGLISGRGALRGQEPQPLATALINDDLVLIASGRTVLERALDASQIEELHQASLPGLARVVGQAGEGVALVVARPAALRRQLGLPLPAAQGPELLVAALRPSGRGVRLDARLDGGPPPPALAPLQADALLDPLAASPTSLALVENAAEQLQHPLLGPWLQAILAAAGADQPLPQAVAAADGGPLLLASGEGGWLLGTAAADPDPQALQPALTAAGLTAAPLERAGQDLQVWTHLSVAGGRGARPDGLRVELAAARRPAGAVAWWSPSLALLERADGARPAAALLRRRDQLRALAWPQAPLQWALGPSAARARMAAWRPWRLLSGLAATPLADPVDGLAVAVGADGDGWQLRAALSLEGDDG